MINNFHIKKIMDVIAVILFMIICFFILFVYSLFNGPPFGGILAENKILNYASAMYGSTQVSTKAIYNFKDGYYHAEVSDEKGQNIKEIKFKLSENVLFDDIIQERVSIQFESDFSVIKESFPNTIQIPTQGFIYTVIYATGQYSVRIEELSLRNRLYILGIVNSDVNITESESMEKPAEITRKILDKLGGKYNITAVQIIYTDINGVFKIEERYSDFDKLCNNLEKDTYKSTRIGEKDSQIIESLKLKKGE